VSERKVIIFEQSAWHLVFVQTLISIYFCHSIY